MKKLGLMALPFARSERFVIHCPRVATGTLDFFCVLMFMNCIFTVPSALMEFIPIRPLEYVDVFVLTIFHELGASCPDAPVIQVVNNAWPLIVRWTTVVIRRNDPKPWTIVRFYI